MSIALVRPDAVVTRLRPRAAPVAVLFAAQPRTATLATVPAHLRLEKTAADRWSITIRRAGPATREFPLVLIERHRAWFEVTSAITGHWSAFATFTGSLAHAVTMALASTVGGASLPSTAERSGGGATVTSLTGRAPRGTGGPRSDSDPGARPIDDPFGVHQPGSVS